MRDVAAHTIAYLGQSAARLMMNMVRTRFDIDRLNAKGLRYNAGLAPEQLIRLMRQGVRPSGAAALYGGRVALIECLIHQQDIRRPLGQLRTIPEERLRVSLNYARVSPVIAGARRTRGARLVATDMDWSAGHGPEVRGPRIRRGSPAGVMANLAELELELGRERRVASRESRRMRQFPAMKPVKLTAERQEQLPPACSDWRTRSRISGCFGIGRATAHRYLAQCAKD